MRDAIGGSVNLVIIVVFMLLVSGYLAFNINYTKAFRVKNKIITTYEEYDGNCADGTACYDQIKKYMGEIGYNVHVMQAADVASYYPAISGACHNVSTLSVGVDKCSICPDGDYCAIRVVDTKEVLGGEKQHYVYYKIVTRVNMDIPIINKMFDQLTFFQVSGDTKKFLVK